MDPVQYICLTGIKAHASWKRVCDAGLGRFSGTLVPCSRPCAPACLIITQMSAPLRPSFCAPASRLTFGVCLLTFPDLGALRPRSRWPANRSSPCAFALMCVCKKKWGGAREIPSAAPCVVINPPPVQSANHHDSRIHHSALAVVSQRMDCALDPYRLPCSSLSGKDHSNQTSKFVLV